MYTNRERGDHFDAWVLTQLSAILPSLRQTVGSGSVFGDQDQVSDEFRISIKLRGGRGLTRRELLEPYMLETIGSMRAPLTVLRVELLEGEEWTRADYVIVDGLILKIYTTDLVRMGLLELDDWEILNDWPAGASLGLLSMLRRGKFLVLHHFPSQETHSFIFTLDDFLDLLSDLARYQLEQIGELTV